MKHLSLSSPIFFSSLSSLIPLCIALCAPFAVSTPAYADGLVIADCPPILVPLATPIAIPNPEIVTAVPSPYLPPVITPSPRGTIIAPRPLPCANYLSVKNHNVSVTIENQIARTRIDQTFVNDSAYSLEGTYIFPLPDDASIGEFAMWVDGKRLEGAVLDKNQARQIYEEIVRKRRDPALLEYVGRGALQARLFPIEPKGQRRVEIEYSQILKLDNGLVRYVYPLKTEAFSPKPLASVSINVAIRSNAALKAIYSPSHDVSISRDGDYRARVGYEASNVKPDRDFVLYYSVTQDEVGVNLLSYKQSGEDGFFVLLVSPQVKSAVESSDIIAKDVLLVLDVSGSMQGAKIEQAKRALNYILDQLDSNDRFNIVAFSTGTNAYAAALQPASARSAAKNFVARLRAEGSTDINRALLEALRGADRERPTIVIFLTDGLPTTGETNSQRIITNVTNVAGKNVRLFAFGVGDDVNTLLLDTLAEKLRGASGYVRPSEKIDEVVSAFYAKVSTPVLADVTMDWGGIAVSDVYPYPLPDLFAGTQLVVAGRYRNGGATIITLKGNVNGAPQSFRYNVTFASAGGEDSLPRLWATRKIGYLLNEIRLRGESREIVNEIVALAVRYGIVTPYTSFLVDERQDVLTDKGRSDAAKQAEKSLAPAAMPTSGARAVQQSQEQSQLRGANVAPTVPASKSLGASAPIQFVGDKTFILRNGVWTDTQFDPSKMTPRKVEFNSDVYFGLLDPKGFGNPSGLKYLALGTRVIFVAGGIAYEITDTGETFLAFAATPTAQGAAARETNTQRASTVTPTREVTSTRDDYPGAILRNVLGAAIIGVVGLGLVGGIVIVKTRRRGASKTLRV